MRTGRGRALLLAGTTEGRVLAEYLAKEGCRAVVCVATEYGRDGLLEDTDIGDRLDIRVGRLDVNGMGILLREWNPGLVIDATHPFAAEATRNMKEACRGLAGVRLIRCLRDDSGELDGLAHGGFQGGADCAGAHSVVHVPDPEKAAQWLALREGNILAATGSRDLAAYCKIGDYRERLYARILPSEESIRLCAGLGIRGRHIIAMQGPFSVEMNVALLREFNCRYLVTKASGKAGGVEEKLEAAARAGVTAVIVGRPGPEAGLSLEETKRQIKEWMEHEEKRTI